MRISFFYLWDLNRFWCLIVRFSFLSYFLYSFTIFQENENFIEFLSYYSRRIIELNFLRYIKISFANFWNCAPNFRSGFDFNWNSNGTLMERIDKILNSSFHLDSNFNLIKIIIKFHLGNFHINLKRLKNLARFSNLIFTIEISIRLKFIIQIQIRIDLKSQFFLKISQQQD